MREHQSHWRRMAKAIVFTFLVTSAAWLIGGAVLFQRMRHEPVSAEPNSVRVASAGFTDAERPALPRRATFSPNVPRLLVPVGGVRPDQLVDTFTQAREGGARAHNAIDIMAPLGTPVLAAAAGQVDRLFLSARGGNTIYVRSPDRLLIYYYAHLDSYAPELAEKQTVRQGQALGTVGFSGDASPEAPHLHFEIQQTTPDAGWWKGRVQLNPYPLLRRR